MFSSPRLRYDYYSQYHERYVPKDGSTSHREVTHLTVTNQSVNLKCIDPNLNFAKLKKNESVILLGLSKTQESLVLDQPNMSKYYDEIKLPKDCSLEEAVGGLVRYSLRKIKYSRTDTQEIVALNKESPLHGVILDNKKINYPIPCSLFINKKVGVCRHLAMLIAYALGRYAAENKIKADVSMFSLLTVNNVGHLVTLWVDEKNCFLIDSSYREINQSPFINLNTYEGHCYLVKHYLAEHVSSIYLQYNIPIPKHPSSRAPVPLTEEERSESLPIKKEVRRVVIHRFPPSAPPLVAPSAVSPLTTPEVNTKHRVVFHR